MPLNIGRMGMSRQALQPWGSWAPGREGPVAALTVILPRPLGAWGVGVPPQALGTHLRWPCVGSCWDGPAGAACGTCLHLVSPAGGLGVGTRSSCSDIAGMGREASYEPTPPPGSGWGEAGSQCICYLVLPGALLDRGGALPALLPVRQLQARVSEVPGILLPTWWARGVGGIGHEARRQ